MFAVVLAVVFFVLVIVIERVTAGEDFEPPCCAGSRYCQALQHGNVHAFFGLIIQVCICTEINMLLFVSSPKSKSQLLQVALDT